MHHAIEELARLKEPFQTRVIRRLAQTLVREVQPQLDELAALRDSLTAAELKRASHRRQGASDA